MTPDRPHIRIEPGLRHGDMTIRSIRISILADMAMGDGATAVMDDYEVSREELLVACWAVGAYGITGVSGPKGGRMTRDSARQYKHWREWAAEHHFDLYRGRYDAVPFPPGVDE